MAAHRPVSIHKTDTTAFRHLRREKSGGSSRAAGSRGVAISGQRSAVSHGRRGHGRLSRTRSLATGFRGMALARPNRAYPPQQSGASVLGRWWTGWI